MSKHHTGKNAIRIHFSTYTVVWTYTALAAAACLPLPKLAAKIELKAYRREIQLADFN